MKKQTFEQVLDFVNKHQRTPNLREWENIGTEQQQETDDYLKKETGWSLTEFIKAETQNFFKKRKSL
jgi:hypothetical protein